MFQDMSDTTTAITAQLHQININFNPHPALSSEGEFIENVINCTQAVLLTAKNFSFTVNYKLNALLSHVNNFFSAELAAVLELYNKLSTVLNLILCTYENSLSHQTAVLRQVMEHDIVKVIKDLTAESKSMLMYATATTAKTIFSNNFLQTVSAMRQSHKKQIQQINCSLHQEQKDKQVMIKLSAAHTACDLDLQTIHEQIHIMISDLIWITDV
ncbi:uncharacterized protein PADG_08104 [Paracoccidioides brasiliensis Pb18]|uniref:Uncharacterized protein n=1 Tax=Paracoccidioides brasiliensis (strain Pb18) TaxID=502780 RepID=C1GLG8_PARBD|nr:uncharacterized protein PADG_08104 [Paracoccidioides brasiliensis Pb18]EEH43284.2 hypothetical protein PADG_08104 [Paracoccidioides brasiliensis Pb18]